MAILPTVDPKLFTRDFEIGDTGADVAQLHKVMQFLGYAPGEDDLKTQTYGESTQQAAERMREGMAQLREKNPLLGGLLDFILQYVFQIDPEELDPELKRGDAQKIRNYRSDDGYLLDALEAGIGGSKGATRAAELARRFVGERETGNNCGAVVRHFTGTQNVPWCGGFVNYVMDHAIAPGLFDQPDALRARSFKDEAAKYGAFREPQTGYRPHVGDVVVFERGKGQGHVGIVTDVGADGKVTYVSGNDGNAVRARTFDAAHPPHSLLGYADTHALAAKKHIDLGVEEKTAAMPSRKVVAEAHNDRAIARG